MRRKLITYCVGIAVVITLLMFSLGLVNEHQSNLKQAENEVIAVAKMYRDIYKGDNSVIVKSNADVRVTVMDSSGRVVADTDIADVSTLPNHSDRIEVNAALMDAPVVAVRNSSSTGVKTIYYALKVDMGGGEFVIVRAAVSVVSVNAYLLSSLPWAIGILVLAIGVSVALAYFLSSKMLTPIKAVNDSVNAQMRSEFFANAGHELKSPLTAISGFAEILQAENHDEKLQVPVDNIAKNAARMTALVDDMLKLSNLESGKAIETLPIKLELIAQEVALDLTALAEERQVSIAVSGAGTVTAGYDHIYSLLKNLIENAVKYNSQGGKVTISIEETDSGVVLSVADTGIGIAEEHQSRVFERFYRVDKGRSRKEGGTGLGLAIVKHICLVYNADLALLSRVGQGTKVTVVFRKQ